MSPIARIARRRRGALGHVATAGVAVAQNYQPQPDLRHAQPERPASRPIRTSSTCSRAARIDAHDAQLVLPRLHRQRAGRAPELHRRLSYPLIISAGLQRRHDARRQRAGRHLVLRRRRRRQRPEPAASASTTRRAASYDIWVGTYGSATPAAGAALHLRAQHPISRRPMTDGKGRGDARPLFVWGRSGNPAPSFYRAGQRGSDALVAELVDALP